MIKCVSVVCVVVAAFLHCSLAGELQWRGVKNMLKAGADLAYLSFQNGLRYLKFLEIDQPVGIDFYGHPAAETIRDHPAWKTLEQYECGESAADRIIGGLDAGLGQFPWIVRLGYKSDGEPELDWMCGGVLVTDRHVVTAAHCLTDADSGYELSLLRMGELNTETDPDCQLQVCAPQVQDRKPKIIKPHPDFNNPAFHNDIAIISLESPVELNEYVSPICLPYNDEQLQVLPFGEMLTVAGWGKMNMTTEERAHMLQYVQIPIQEKSACNLFGKAFKMGPSQICAGAIQHKDACGGDSGGPVMRVYDTDEGPKNYLIGVVSFGPTVCGIKKPGVYSSTVSYLKWILDNIMQM